MNINLTAQNPLEWLALQSGLIPKPVLLAHFGFMVSKIISAAIDANVLEAMAQKQYTPAAIAAFSGLDEKAVTSLLSALVGLQLVAYKNKKFTLTPASKKWLLKDASASYTAQLLFDSKVCYPWLNSIGSYLKTGKGLQYHDTLQAEEWTLYQNAMRDTSGLISQIAAKKIKLPSSATTLLDIGGAHGLYSTALLQQHPQLSATVLDLPEAIAANTGAINPYPDRLSFKAGNILKDDLVPESFDAVIMANVAHHFTEAENLLVTNKVFRALKPGGSFYILEFFRKDITAASDTIGALQSFFFSFSSTSGLWTAADLKSWLLSNNFTSVKSQKFVQLPGFGIVGGQKR